MRRWLMVCGLLAATMLAAGGCSSGGDGGSSGGVTGTQFGERYCALIKPCCQAMGITGDLPICKLLMSATPADMSAAEQCLAHYEQQAQQADWCDIVGEPPRPESCEIAYPQPVGTKQPGEACQTSDDCAPSSEGEVQCHSESFDSPKFCRVVVHVGLGEACIGTYDDPVLYLDGPQDGSSKVGVCDVADGVHCKDGTCVQASSLGGPCTSDYECAGESYCGGGTCTEKVAAGFACPVSSACLDGTYCDDFDQICVAKKPDGASCFASTECQSFHCGATKVCEKFDSGGSALGLAILCN